MAEQNMRLLTIPRSFRKSCTVFSFNPQPQAEAGYVALVEMRSELLPFSHQLKPLTGRGINGDWEKDVIIIPKRIAKLGDKFFVCGIREGSAKKWYFQME